MSELHSNLWHRQPSPFLVTVHWHLLSNLTKYALPRAIIFLVSYTVYTLISCLLHLKMLGAAQNREIVYWHLVFDTLSRWVSSSWHLKGCNVFVFKDQAVFLYFLAFEDESTIKTSNGRCHSPRSTVSPFRYVSTLLWECLISHCVIYPWMQQVCSKHL